MFTASYEAPRRRDRRRLDGGQRRDEQSQRIQEAAMAILQASPGQELNITLLNKALFYLDLAMLRDAGETLTHASYLALDQGPLVAKYPSRLVRKLEEAGLASQGDDGVNKPVKVSRPLRQFKYLNADARKAATLVAHYFAAMTASKASKYSHDNPGWIAAYEAGYKRGTTPKLINLDLALQQLAEDQRPDPERSRQAQRAGEILTDSRV
jgi:hypothetical protein